MNVLGLFAGIGGLELGIRLAVPGSRAVCYVERDAYAAATLVARMEEQALDPAPIWDDVTTFDGRPWRRVVDCIAGGFPCQDLSVAGKGAGLDGARSGLWSEYARIVREVGPRYVFVENVAALATRGLDRVLGDLASLGFDAEWDVLSAGGVGAPHRRQRLFLLAERVPDAERDAVWLEPERGRGASPSTDEGHAQSRNVGVPMAHARCVRLEGREPIREAREAAQNERCCSELGDSEVELLEGHGSIDCSSIWDAGLPDGADQEDMGDADGARRPQAGSGHELDSGQQSESRQRELGDADRGRFGWPPGPGDTEGWRDYLAAGGPLPALRRGVDGSAEGLEYRADRLRCLGNGVVPQVAARAWVELRQRLDRRVPERKQGDSNKNPCAPINMGVR